ncbi:MAG: TRAP transporter substrate-binding protein DctP [Desulfobacteraceae bacterium]|nr:TRAP transporter substrate-binding protein DctP [Desulfobacteraceae bacterium]
MRTAKQCIVMIISLMVFFGFAGFLHASDSSEKISLKLQTHLPPHDTKDTLNKFVEAVSDLSDGQIEIKLFSAGAMVPTKELLNAVGYGTPEMALVAEGYWHKKIPVSEVAGMPFAFQNLSEAKNFMFDQGFGELLKQEYARHNIYHIPYDTYSVGLMTNDPINSVEDMKGMKIRAYGVMAEWLTEMGVSTTYISGGELYTALSTGVVDGAHWGNAGPMYDMKFHEVVKNYMKPEPIVGAWNILMINKDVWEDFTPVQQNIIETAAMAMGSSKETDENLVFSEKSLRKMQSEWDVKVNHLSEADINKMKKAARSVWEKTAEKDSTNAKAINMMKEFLKELGHLD